MNTIIHMNHAIREWYEPTPQPTPEQRAAILRDLIERGVGSDAMRLRWEAELADIENSLWLEAAREYGITQSEEQVDAFLSFMDMLYEEVAP